MEADERINVKVFDYGISTTKEGLPQVAVLFRDGEGRDYRWNGTLKPGRGQELTLDALIVMGLRSDNLADLAKGAESGLLDREKEVQLTVGDEEYQGVVRRKVKWVNEVGGGGFAQRLSETDAAAKMASLNLSAAFKAKLAERNIAIPTGGAPAKPLPF